MLLFSPFTLNNRKLYDCVYVIQSIFRIEYLSIKGFLDYYYSKYLFWPQYVFIAASSSENFSCTKLIHYIHPTVRYSALFSHLQRNFSKGLPITNIYRWAQMKAHLPSVYFNTAVYCSEKIINWGRRHSFCVINMTS